MFETTSKTERQLEQFEGVFLGNDDQRKLFAAWIDANFHNRKKHIEDNVPKTEKLLEDFNTINLDKNGHRKLFAAWFDANFTQELTFKQRFLRNQKAIDSFFKHFGLD